jgi:chromosome segregation protein
MKLTRLKIHGFKSFLDAADIPIEPGVTGIVGPNGCGKSNLVEALRFVMGESSYKAMRGGGMDDVIFSGAGQRPARNIAEVTLVAERAAADDERDVEVIEITRRIARESGSDYRLNGREVRARDVQLLFADAATGAHSSALVRQGQVAELIAAKPEKRRGILEDAAGIAGLHARRGEAEGRLKAAEANLERLSDVMAEIEAQLEALRRQARQAVRYRKLSSDIRQVEATLLTLNWESAVARLGEAEAQLAGASVAFATAAEAQTLSARDEAVAAACLPELRDQAASASAALQRLRIAAADLDREEARLAKLRQDLTARHAQAAADLEHQAEIGRDAQAALARLDEEEAKLRQEGVKAAEGLGTARALAEEAAVAAASADAEATSATNALAAALAERAARERALREAQARLSRLGEEHKAVAAQRDRLQADHGAAGGRETAALAFAEAEARLGELETQAQAAEAAAMAAVEAEQTSRGPSEAADRYLNALQAEARAVTGLLDPDGRSQYPPVSDALNVAQGFEIALAAALGADLEAPLDADAPAHWGVGGDGEDDPALPAGSEPLSLYVSGPDRLRRRLRQVGVIEDADADALFPQLAPGQRLVTREGALWRWDGLRARPGSPNAGVSRLQQRNRLADLLADIQAAQNRAAEASSKFQAAKVARVEAQRLDSVARDAVREGRRILEASRATLADADRRANRIGESLSAFAGGLARIEADTEAARAEVQAAGHALAELSETTDLRSRRDALQVRSVERRGRAAELRLDVEKAAHAKELRLRRAAHIASEREQWSARVRKAGERAAELSGRLGPDRFRTHRVGGEPRNFERRRRALLGEVAGAEQIVAAASDRLAEAETRHRQAAQRARAALRGIRLGARGARPR